VTGDESFERQLGDLRPALHRFCARMTGSAVDGEDIVQQVLVRAVEARRAGTQIAHLRGWLFRVAHNACLDLLRASRRSRVVALTEEALAAPTPDAAPETATVSFQTFLLLPALQRCAVILKDVFGHSIEEIADLAGCSPAAAKSALQRGRATLRQLAQQPETLRLPLLSDDDRRRLQAFVDGFRAGEFDAIRRLLADDVRLDLVARLQLEGREKTGTYFTRYAEALHWRFALGAVDGAPVMLVFDARGNMDRPSHFVQIDWRDGRIAGIRDFLFAPYALEAADWARLN
jgi:RNA polymerase sigma-70 factor (ECF subfamily)